MERIVKLFNTSKDFGFITGDDATKTCVCPSSIQCNCFKSLAEGNRISSDIERGPKGQGAIADIRL